MAVYSAGTVYLQVVPSFRNVQNLIRREAKDAGRTWDDEFAKSSDPSRSIGAGLDRAGKAAGRAGKAAGDDYSGNFEKVVKARIERALQSLPKVKITADSSDADRSIDLIRHELETLRDAKIGVDVDSRTFFAEVDRMHAKLAELSTDDARIEVRANSASALAELEALRKVVKSVDGDDVNIKVDIDGAAKAVAELEAVEAAERHVANGSDQSATSFRAFSGVLLLISSVGAAAIPILAALAGAALAIGPAFLAAAAGGGVLYLAFSGISKAVKALQAEHKNAQNDALTTGKAMESAARGVRNAEQSLAQAREQGARTAQDSARRVADAQEKVKSAQVAATRSAQDSARRIADAEQDVIDAQENAERAAADAADAIVEAQARVVEAQENAARHVQEAAEEQTRAARDVSDAQQNLARVMEDVSRRNERALENQAQAERDLADAQRDVLKAQEDLNAARDRAQNDIEDLNSAVVRGNLDERQTVLDLAEAQQRLADIDAAGTGGAAREEAQIRVERLTLALADQRIENERLAEQKAESDANGVEGSERVQTAQERLTQAIEAQAEAQRQVGVAALEVQQVQIENARVIEAAQRAISDAFAAQARTADDAARQAVDDAEAVASAQKALHDATMAADRIDLENSRSIHAAEMALADTRVAAADRAVADAARVADAQQAVKDAFLAQTRASADAARSIAMAQQALADAQRSQAEAGEKVTASARNTKDAMDQLGPAGQDFARFIADSVLPGLAKLRAVAEAGVLPGVMELFRDLGGAYGSSFVTFIANMAKVMGDLFRQLGKALIGPEFKDFFATMAKYAPIFTQQFGTILINVAKGFASLMTALAPLTKKMGDGLVSLTDAFAKWSTTAGDENSGFQKFLRYVERVGPMVLSFIGALTSAMGALAEALAPLGGAILTGLTGLLNFIADMNPDVLQAVAVALIGLLLAVQVAQGINALATSFKVLRGSLMAIMGAEGAAGATAGGVIGIIIVGLVLLGIALYELYTHSETFRNIVNAVWDAVKVAFSAMVDGMTWAWENVLKPTVDAIGTAFSWLWANILKPVFEAIGKAAVWLWENVLKPAWAAMKIAWDALVTGLKWAWDHILKPVFDAIGSVFNVLWEVILNPIFQVWKLEWDILIFALQKAWDYILKPVFEAIGTAFSWLWTNVLKPTMGWIGNRFADLGTAIKRVWDEVLSPVFGFFADIFRDYIEPAFMAGVNAIGDLWDGIVSLVKTPIEFVVNTVINGGVIDTFNKVAGWFGSDAHIGHVPLPTGWNRPPKPPAGKNFGLADGGRVPGWSPNPKADNIHAMLTAGEFVQPVDVVNYYGVDFMEALRRRAIPRYADGGVVGELKSLGSKFADAFGALNPAELLHHVVDALLDRIPGGAAGRAVRGMPRKVLDFAVEKVKGLFKMGDDGQVLGDFGSTVASAVQAATGLGARGDGDWPQIVGYLKGTGVPFSVTSTTGGQHAPGSFHYAGRAVDLVGPDMRSIFDALLAVSSQLSELFYTPAGFSIKNGRRVAPIAASDHFDHVHAAYGSGGLVRPYLMDSGGVIPPGLSTILNLTGGNETAAVLTPQQLASVQRAEGAGGSGAFEGTLYLDDGAFIGQVRGVLREEDRASGQADRGRRG